jgi:nucleoid DNA-binding protein
MTKQELIEKVARTPGLPHELNKKTIALVVDAVFAVIGDYFVRAKLTRRETPRFTFPGFGTFTKKRRTERVGRNPRNGELIDIPASTTVSFTPGLELRAHLNRNAPLKHNS